MSFMYLGIQITSHQDLQTEVKIQSIKALRISGCLNNAVWSNTRPDTSKTRQILETAETKTLRRILGVSLFDKQRSEDIREKCEIQKIDDWVKCRRENWYAHVERMSED